MISQKVLVEIRFGNALNNLTAICTALGKPSTSFSLTIDQSAADRADSSEVVGLQTDIPERE